MTQERLNSILSKIAGKYAGYDSTPTLVHKIYEELSAVVRGLHKTENFLNVSIDTEKKVIICKDVESLHYLGLIPYLANKLMDDNSPYLIYLVEEGNYISLQCVVVFRDVYDCEVEDCNFGFEAEVYPVNHLGIYYPKDNRFKRLEE